MPKKKPRSDRSKHALDAEEVIAYLREHPNFLTNHPELLNVLLPPNRHSENRVVDMQHFMLRKLQADNEKLKSLSEEMVRHTRDHLQGEQRVHSAIISLLSAISFEDLLQTITTDLPVQLGIESVNLCIEADDLFDNPSPIQGIQLLEPGTVEDIMGERLVLMRSDITGDTALFGAMAGVVRADALIRLVIDEAAPDGLLVLGSRKTDIFKNQFGGELLGFLGQVAEITIRNWLASEPLE